MIPDSVKLFFLDVDHVVITFFTMFFLAEPVMLYMFPLVLCWIPVATIVSKFGLMWLMPEKAGRFPHFIMLLLISLIGYAVLLYAAHSTLWFSMTMMISMTIILILQFAGVTPDAEDRVRTRMEQKEELWQECYDIEHEDD